MRTRPFKDLEEQLYKKNPGLKERVAAQIKQWILEIEQKKRRRAAARHRAKAQTPAPKPGGE